MKNSRIHRYRNITTLTYSTTEGVALSFLGYRSKKEGGKKNGQVDFDREWGSIPFSI